MFDELPKVGHRRWDLALLVSLVLHVMAIAILMHRPKPIFVMPSDVALGLPGSSGSVIYLAPVGAEKAQAPVERPKIALLKQESKLPAPPAPTPRTAKDDKAHDDGQFDASMHAGSLYGSRIPGAPLIGHEIIPALPQVFPDPAISRDDLPPGVQGDVIVEVTIDDRGNVIGLKLIHGIGYGIEQRVLATLQQWRFRPASKDGVTIASQHIVTFHYPS